MKIFKQPLELSLFECLTVVSFLGLGYLLIYKLTFYSVLGIPWYITSLTPSYIFFSSLGIVLISLFCFICGYFFNLIFPFDSKRALILGIVLIILGLYKVFFNKYNFPLFNKAIPFFSVTLYVYFLLQLFKHHKEKARQYSSLKSARVLLIGALSLLTLSIYVYFPFWIGFNDADDLKKGRKTTISMIKLKNEEKYNWEMVEFLNDRALLKGRENTFKIVEYKDIDMIKKVNRKD